MTVLLQTRVERRVAQNFKRAAKLRGKTPYAYLQQLVTEAAAAPEPRNPWANHRKMVESWKLKPLSYKIVVRMREESDER